MQTLKDQVTKDMKSIKTKLLSIKKIAKKMSIKSWVVLGGFALVSIGLFVAMVASRQTAENRSGATGGGSLYYFSPVAAVITKVGDVIQPVQNIQIGLTAGRPIVSYSFVMKLTYADGTPVTNAVWSQVTFVPNAKFVANQSELLVIPGTKIFAGTIGQQPGGVTTLASAVSDGILGSFRFMLSGLQQPDLRMTFFAVPNKPQANAAYVLGRLLNPPAADGEVVIPQEDFNNQFNLHNPFLAVGSPTPTPIAAVVSRATLQYAVSNGAPWNQLDARFNGFNDGGTVKSLIRVQDIDPPWRVEGLSPAFRLRIKNAQGVYKQTTIGGQLTNVLVNFEPSGSIAEGQFWVNWKVVSNPTELKFIQIPGTTDKLQFDPGDTIEVTINLRKEQNGVSYTCKETDELTVAPIGRPEEQQVLGPCRNDSDVAVTWGAPVGPTATPTPTTNMTATATPTPTINSQVCAAPQGFTVTTPNGGTCNGDGTMTIRYSWAPVLGATSYDLMISTSPDFSSNTYTWTGIITTLVTKNITSPTIPRYHRVRVSAKTGCTVPGAWSIQTSTSACTMPGAATATPTPTSTQQAFQCPVIHTTLEAMSVNAPLPATGTTESFANFTLSSAMATQVTTKWSRLVRNGTTTTVCSSANIATTNLTPTTAGTPVILQSKAATPCVISSVGYYLPQTLFTLTDGRTVTCESDSAISVQ